MDYEALEKLDFCPYCFQDFGVMSREFEVAFRTWKYYDAEKKEFKLNLSGEPDVIVFCVACENEILEQDIDDGVAK